MPSSRKTLLTVDFKPGQALKYKFVNSRNMTVDWGAMKGGKTKISKSSESLEMVVSYTPVEVDPYGVSTIRADCESAKAKRTSESARQQNWQEAAETFAGKSWTFTVDARGKIVDGSGFRDVLLQGVSGHSGPTEAKVSLKTRICFSMLLRRSGSCGIRYRA